ncbi:AcrR family transcriptional regulator [Mycolicibacterium sp. BK556]|uniref:TetR/AcrR family transcriptional regulator n=1 Tax=unclassified Mycolicibacterium TaxID=2636767 RepID=UPI001609DF33|nr:MULTISPECIES: TetR/AcrR family transcriptional regulator [unclassified Mycolicibacterium]MBB3603387.1 AcrR family transcriptional regulator [Mycolicibacterium sp. BK556]MBB3633582.1 AcrR family transcriptional regulator [Mycolicibacterium sp. BK607]MBB3751164.1 AcrR family transcriptional regulator [Mycolicibacterium sp. BK634]
MVRRTEILQSAAALIAVSGLRTSLQEIADAAGIQAGSLYHHFESKEAILVELLRRYHDDLDRTAAQAESRLDDEATSSMFDRLVDLGSAIAQCAVTHRAALQMTFYEFPSPDPELTALAQQRPTAILQATLQTLRAARWSGYVGPDVDLPVFADRFVQTMLHVGLDVIRHNAGADKLAALFCRILLEGLAAEAVTDAALDASAAYRAADEVVRSWQERTDPADDGERIRAIARAEFGRKGFEFTTIRDIASASGLGTGTVYRLIGSKDQLLADIMREFGEKIAPGWTQVLQSDSSPLEKIDAMSWIHTNVLDRFGDEFRIQLAWMRQSPPDTSSPGWLFSTRVSQMKSILAEGIRSGEISIDSPSNEMLARAVIEISWIPENILRAIGTRASQIHVRDTSIRGVTRR